MLTTATIGTLPHGQVIKRYRTFQGMNQVELAKTSGISPQYLSVLESGKASPTAAILQRMAKALGVTSAHLLGEVPFMADWPKES